MRMYCISVKQREPGEQARKTAIRQGACFSSLTFSVIPPFSNTTSIQLNPPSLHTVPAINICAQKYIPNPIAGFNHPGFPALRFPNASFATKMSEATNIAAPRRR